MKLKQSYDFQFEHNVWKEKRWRQENFRQAASDGVGVTGGIMGTYGPHDLHTNGE